MTKRSIILGAIAALMIGCVAYVLSAQPLDRAFDQEWTGDWNHSRRLERITQYLELDAIQTEQWLQIIDDQQNRRTSRRDQIMELRARFKEIADQSSPDLEVLGQIALDIYTELEASRLERDQVTSDLDSILTAEQRERFEALQAARDFSGPKHHRGSKPPRIDPGGG